MPNINNAEYVSTLPLDDLRAESRVAIAQLPEAVQDVYRDAKISAHHRSEKIRAIELIEEFTAPFCGHVNRLHYELAFKPDWNETNRDLYQARWWINEYCGACYFIFDSENTLQYIGSACSGALGNRIYHTNHREYTDSVDVVLFDRRWSHYSLAFEALAISRLRPPKNRQFANYWVEPFPPWDQIWPKP